MTDKITLAHGSGGELYRQMVNEIFLPAFSNEIYAELNDSAVCRGADKIALTTDSFVVNPLFFPGGDVGSLAVSGTVNDLSVSGAKPLYLTVGMIIEAGFETEKLGKICSSIAHTTAEAGVRIVTGDTKVVEKGKCDGIYINTAGVGVFDEIHKPVSGHICEGDVIICSGCIARHGTAIMSARHSLSFEPAPVSDAAPLFELTDALAKAGIEIHAMRDPTRGGVAATLCEWTENTALDIVVDSCSLPVDRRTESVCSMLGIEPMNIANEGVILFSVPKAEASRTVDILRALKHGADASLCAEVESGSGKVYMLTEIGAKRRVLMPSGEILPRIC